MASPEHPVVFGIIFFAIVSLLLLCCFLTCRRGQLATYIMDPRRASYRYVILCLVVMFIPGPYFHEGLLQTFKGPISDSMQISNSQFASLFAVSSFTGVFCAPAGAVISKLGRTRFAVGASFAAAAGSTLVTLGFHWQLLAVMLIGRFVFWLALNGLLMVQTILVYDLFSGAALNGAMTFIVCSIRLGGALSYFLSGPLLQWLGVLTSIWLSVALVFGAFVSTLIFAYLFRGSAITRAVQHPAGRRTARESFSLKLVRQVPISMFFFLGGIAAVWGTVFPFEVVGDDMLQKDFGYSANLAGIIISIAPSISICSPLIAPFLGTTLYRKLLSCFAGLAILACSFIVLCLEFPVTGVLVLGVGYAISVCSFYSTLPILVKSQVPNDIAKSVETLLVGLNMVGSGLSMIASNLVIGVIKDSGSYKGANIYLCCMCILGICSLVACIAFRTSMSTQQASIDGEMLEQSESVGSDVVVSQTGLKLAITDEYCPAPAESFSRALSLVSNESQPPEVS